MKKFFFASCALGLFLFSFVLFGWARDGALVEWSSFTEGKSAPTHFGVTVTSDGKVKPEPGPVFTEGKEAEGTVLPYLRSNPKPIAYPRWAIRQGWEGTLVIAVEILEDGRVGRWQVMESTGYAILDKAAVKAIREWQFEPARKEGRPLVACIQIPVHFRLEGSFVRNSI
jgi:protein TonB